MYKVKNVHQTKTAREALDNVGEETIEIRKVSKDGEMLMSKEDLDREAKNEKSDGQ